MQGPNRYAYVGGNPETWSDPTGHCYIVADGYCIHGSRGKTTGGSPSSQKIKGCSGTATQCNHWFALKKHAAAAKANNEYLASTVIGIVMLFADLYKLMKGGQTSGLKWWSDLVSIVGDILHIGVNLTSWLAGKGLTSIGGISMSKIHEGIAAMSAFVNKAAIFLQTLSSIPLANMVATGAAYSAMALLDGANPFELVLTVAGGIASTYLPQLFGSAATGNMLEIAGHAYQAYIDTQEAQIQEINNESIDQWCSKSGECN